MTNKNLLLRIAAAAGALAIIPLAGCGGSSTNGDKIVTTQAADPYIFGFGDNVTSTEVSGFGSGSAGNPASTDIFYFTFASANSAPTLTESGAGPFVTGIAGGSIGTVGATGVTTYSGSFALGSYVAGVPAGSTNVFFRAQGAQGQTTSRIVPDITAATLSVDGGTTQGFTFPAYDQTTAAGPFVSSPYYLPTSFAGIAASGVYPSTATITDAAKNTTTTTFQSVVLAATDGAIAATVGSGGSIVVTGATPSVVYGPDASGTEIVILPASTTPVTATVTFADGVPADTSTFTGPVTAEAGQVYISPNSTATTAAAIKRHNLAMKKLAHRL